MKMDGLSGRKRKDGADKERRSTSYSSEGEISVP